MSSQDTSSDLIEAAEAARTAGDSEAALAAALEAVEVARMADDRALDLAKSLRLQALSLDDLGRSVEAIQIWQETREFFQGLGIAESVAECDARLSR